MTRLFSFFLFLMLVAPHAHAAEAYAVAKVNLRAGPDGGYPVVDILKSGERVELLGCLDGHQWCEVETNNGEHGWVYAHYLGTSYQGNSLTIIQRNGDGLKIITFNPRNYWSQYYRTKYFYKDRDRWLPPHHHHDDDDDDHGHHPPVEPRPPKPVKEPEPPKYKPMEMPSRKSYNPLCPMGQTDC